MGRSSSYEEAVPGAGSEGRVLLFLIGSLVEVPDQRPGCVFATAVDDHGLDLRAMDDDLLAGPPPVGNPESSPLGVAQGFPEARSLVDHLLPSFLTALRC